MHRVVPVLGHLDAPDELTKLRWVREWAMRLIYTAEFWGPHLTRQRAFQRWLHVQAMAIHGVCPLSKPVLDMLICRLHEGRDFFKEARK